MLRTPAVSAASIAPIDLEAARKCVEVFSREVDELIDVLTKDRLQIKRDSKPKGLFAFDPAPLIIYYLRANIHEGSTFGELLNRVLDALQIYLSLSLQNVRRYITEEFSAGIAASVERFRLAIDERVGPPLRSELQELIGRVSPELQASVERVASWFAPDAENERRALRTMEQIVEIAIEATNNAHRGFDPLLNFQIDDLGLQSTETLIVFTDILFTILDNIYTHSGLDHKPVIGISIVNEGDVPEGGTRVRILVTNRIAERNRSVTNERRLQRIREQMDSGDYRALSKLEGGTGLLKLKRIVAADNRQTLDFGYRSDALEFFVEITMILVFAPAPQPTELHSSRL